MNYLVDFRTEFRYNKNISSTLNQMHVLSASLAIRRSVDDMRVFMRPIEAITNFVYVEV